MDLSTSRQKIKLVFLFLSAADGCFCTGKCTFTSYQTAAGLQAGHTSALLENAHTLAVTEALEAS